MDCRENSSKFQQQMQPFGFVEQEQYNSSPHFSSYPSNNCFSLYTPNQHYNNNFSKFCPMFSPNMEFNNEVRSFNATRPEDLSSSCAAKSDTDSCSEGGGSGGGDGENGVSDGEVSLDELLLDGKAKKKIEQLAALVGVDTTEPAVVLAEVVRVLKVFKKINMY